MNRCPDGYAGGYPRRLPRNGGYSDYTNLHNPMSNKAARRDSNLTSLSLSLAPDPNPASSPLSRVSRALRGGSGKEELLPKSTTLSPLRVAQVILLDEVHNLIRPSAGTPPRPPLAITPVDVSRRCIVRLVHHELVATQSIT